MTIITMDIDLVVFLVIQQTEEQEHQLKIK